jgi:uncharacterized protein YdaU (DUF1376 family)
LVDERNSTDRRSPAFQFYPKDFLSDENVRMMSLQERGAYITLLSLCWIEGSLPADPSMLARLCGTPVAAFRRLWPALERCFRLVPTDPSRLVHPRLEREREKQSAFRGRQTDASDSRWGEHRRDQQGKLARKTRLADARALGTHSEIEWAEMLTAYGRCLKCQSSAGEIVKDHVIPIYQGGSDAIVNIQPMCRKCNSAKGSDRTDHRIGLPETLPKWLPKGSHVEPERLREGISAVSSLQSVSSDLRQSVPAREAFSARVQDFVDWYRDTHERIIGVGYIGNPNSDYQRACDLCRTFGDQDLRDAALVWFGMDDKWATDGTRTIGKFASRASRCLELAKRVSA